MSRDEYRPEEERNLGARGPEREEIVEQEDELRNDLANQAGRPPR